MELRENVERSRYELLDGDAVVALADYRDHDGVRILPHVETDPALRNRGHAGRVVEFALADIRARGLKVMALCPFAADHLRAHPEHHDLVS